MYALPYIVLVRLHHMALDARRRDRTWRYLLWSAVAGVLAAVLLSIALAVTLILWTVGWWPLAIALLAVIAVPLLEPLISRHLLVPLGWVRPAFWIAHFVSVRDSDAYALCVAAWAHAARPTPTGEAWIVERRDRRLPLGDSEIVVTALLAAARGDADTARLLMRSVALIVEDHPPVRELAGEWLACDAAERGAWSELAADAAAARWPATSLTYFLEGVAARRVDAPGAPSAAELTIRWLLAPRRFATATLRSSPATVPAPAPTSTSPAVADAELVTPATSEPATPSLPRAVAAHVAMSASAATAATLATTVKAWDLALADPATRSWLARRALELDAPMGAVDRALREVVATVTAELGSVADAATLGAPPANGPVGVALVRRLRHGRLDALEAGFTQWVRRRDEWTHHQQLSARRQPIDEWREFIALKAAYDRACAAGGLELRRLAFPHAYTSGTTMAAWLWNAFNEYAMSHAISTWLRAEALAVGDTEAIELCTRNCKLGVPTRTGRVEP
jgi:hypothetical protein